MKNDDGDHTLLIAALLLGWLGLIISSIGLRYQITQLQDRVEKLEQVAKTTK